MKVNRLKAFFTLRLLLLFQAVLKVGFVLVKKRTSKSFLTHLGSVSELMRHYVVEKWIDACRQKVCDAWDVSENDVDTHKQIIAAERLVHNFAVNGHDTLSMEWSPTEEETNNDSNWNCIKMFLNLSLLIDECPLTNLAFEWHGFDPWYSVVSRKFSFSSRTTIYSDAA